MRVFLPYLENIPTLYFFAVKRRSRSALKIRRAFLFVIKEVLLFAPELDTI